jgi:hypothetical protein
MADFTITSSTDFLGIHAQAQRADGTDGTAAPTFTLDKPELGSIATQDGGTSVAFKPAAGANGIATITASGTDENGAPVASAFTVAIVTDQNPTVRFAFTRTH